MSDIPQVGFEMEQRFNRYVLIGVEEIVRMSDGRPSVILHWRSWCHDCGKPFEVTTNRNLKQSMVRRCVFHRRPGSKTRG